MKVSSSLSLISSLTFFRIGSFSKVSGDPARLSSQLGPQDTFIGLPLIWLLGAAVGKVSPAGALVRFS
ncbi:Uncharacterised protein [Mycobacterium tuberculosis]|nr:Uncharacterised protein [Mycobacterium tuberculosis]